MHDALLLHAMHSVSYLRKDLTDSVLAEGLLLRFERLYLLVKLLPLHFLHEQVDVRVIFEAMEQLKDGPKAGGTIGLSLARSLILRSVQVNVNFNFILYAL